MKNLLYIAVLSVSLWSCGGGGDEVNYPPTAPTLLSPANNLLCLENPVTFKWNASTSSNGDVITYQIEVARDTSFTLDKQTFNVQSTTQTIPLMEDIAYYWRVKATDYEDSSSYSLVYKFYTYGVGVTNQLPFKPELIIPGLNSTLASGATTTLQWTADDVNITDILTFDVYFGTDAATLTITSPNQSTTSFVTPILASTTTYYWKVVVKDNKGGQTIGQVWSFTTD